MCVKMIGRLLRAKCLWHMPALACYYASFCRCCSDIRFLYFLRVWVVLTLALCAKCIICSYNWRKWDEGYDVCAGFTTSVDLLWCILVITAFSITPFFVYCFEAFSSRSNVWKVAASVPRVPKCHALVNIRTRELGCKGHLPCFQMRRLGRRHAHWILLEAFCGFASRSVGGSSKTEKRWKALVGGFLRTSIVALSINTLLCIQCSSIIYVFGWTLKMAYGPTPLPWALRLCRWLWLVSQRFWRKGRIAEFCQRRQFCLTKTVERYKSWCRSPAYIVLVLLKAFVCKRLQRTNRCEQLRS